MRYKLKNEMFFGLIIENNADIINYTLLFYRLGRSKKIEHQRTQKQIFRTYLKHI